MRIGVDLDEVLSDTLSGILDEYNAENKTAFKKEDFFSYKYWEVWGGTRDQAIDFVNKIQAKGFSKKVKPLGGAYEILLKLKKEGHEFFIITGRSESDKNYTEEWVNKNYPNIFSGIYFANMFNDKLQKKSEICKDIAIDIFIEDDLEHVLDCVSAGIKVLIFDCLWNRKEDPKNTKRVHSWNEIYKIVSEIKS